MVKIIINQKECNIVGFVINNHAISDERDFHHDVALVGEAFDMVCNSVSVLSQSVLIGLDEVLKLNCTYEISDGYLKLDICLLYTSQSIDVLKGIEIGTFKGKNFNINGFTFDNLKKENMKKEFIDCMSYIKNLSLIHI